MLDDVVGGEILGIDCEGVQLGFVSEVEFYMGGFFCMGAGEQALRGLTGSLGW